MGSGSSQVPKIFLHPENPQFTGSGSRQVGAIPMLKRKPTRIELKVGITARCMRNSTQLQTVDLCMERRGKKHKTSAPPTGSKKPMFDDFEYQACLTLFFAGGGCFGVRGDKKASGKCNFRTIICSLFEPVEDFTSAHAWVNV